MQLVIGIDEVGRGPLAGPVGVGVAMVANDFDWSLIPGVTDSKKLTEAKREAIYKLAWQLRKAGELDWSVAMVSARQIDERGIQWAIRHAMQRALTVLEKRALKYLPFEWKDAEFEQGGTSSRKDLELNKCMVKLDGGLKAPERFMHQETIVKGDAKEPSIGLASIVAKVTRDRYMTRLATLAAYAPYDFATHKGYGTKSHRYAIAKYGFSPEHRVSYCKNIKML